MKKLLSIVLAVAVMATVAFSMFSFSASAAEAVSVLPENASDFTCVPMGAPEPGEITITKQDEGFKFTADKGWPNAYYANPETNKDNWAKAYVNQADCYLNWDFEIKSGEGNVVVFYAGQDPKEQAGDGVAESINYFIDPANGKQSVGTKDLKAGVYKGSKHVSEIGCDEKFMAGEGADRYFNISGIKVFAVGAGAEVIVNNVWVGPKDGGNNDGGNNDGGNNDGGNNDGGNNAPAEDVVTSLFPAAETDFTCVEMGAPEPGAVTVTKEGEGFKFVSDKGWPAAHYSNPVEENWAKAYINKECYLRWDFEVVSGGTNVVVYFQGQNPADDAGPGVGETINYLIDPSKNNLASGAVGDLPVGKYTGEKHVKDLGCKEELIISETDLNDPEAYFNISGIKVFAVGGEVVVNKLEVVLKGSGSNDGGNNDGGNNDGGNNDGGNNDGGNNDGGNNDGGNNDGGNNDGGNNDGGNTDDSTTTTAPTTGANSDATTTTAAPATTTVAPTTGTTKAPDVPKDVPKTGDISDAMLFIVVAIAAAGVVTLSAMTSKKSETR